MSEVQLLRTLADKLESLEAVSVYPETITEPGTLVVTWTAGSDHPGYQAISDAISTLVTQHWAELRLETLRQYEKEVEDVRKELASFQESAAGKPPSVARDPDILIRRLGQPRGI